MTPSMGEHSRSNSHDLLHILGFANVSKTCKSFLSKCYPDKANNFLKKSGSKKKKKTKAIQDKDNDDDDDDARDFSRFKIPTEVTDLTHRDDDTCIKGSDDGDGDGDDAVTFPSRLKRNLSHGWKKKNSAKAFLTRTFSHRDPPSSSAPLTRSTSRGAAAPIIFSSSTGLMKPPVMEKLLECTLEELCFGCTKKVSITRDAVTDNGQIVDQDETVTIKVESGWKKSTKIMFEGKGHQRPGTEAGDVVFVIAEKEHPLFKRQEDDLKLGVEILLVDALAGCTLLLPLLGGETMSLTVEDIVHPGYEKAIEGEGMPKQKEPQTRGDLIINISVKFPEALTEEQRSAAAAILHQTCYH